MRIHPDTQSNAAFIFFGRSKNCAYYEVFLALGAGDARAFGGT